MNFAFVCATPQGLTKEFLAEATALLGRHQYAVLERAELHASRAVRWTLQGDVVSPPLKKDLIALSDRFRVDLAVMDEATFLRPKKLLVFDMDSTLIQHEVIDEMAIDFGIGEQVKQITKRAMNGELNFDQSLSERVGLLKGLPLKALQAISDRLTLMPGAEQLIRTAKAQGAKTVIASGGFTFFAERICQRLQMDEFYANTLEWENGTLTGKVSGSIVNASYKAELLESLCHRDGLELADVVAVGDGANDIPMLLKAGLGFAFHAKEKVRHEAHHQLSFGPMHTLLYFLNIRGEHLT